MIRSTRPSIAPVSALGALVVALTVGCAGDDTCPVARIGSDVLTVGDAMRATGQLLPPPPRDQRLRLAADIAVAHAARGGAPDASLEQRMDAYRAWVREAAGPDERFGDLVPAMEAARHSVGFQPGPCHPGPPPDGG